MGVRSDVTVTNENGVLAYRDMNGELHREDGPAVSTTQGLQSWFSHGLQHREGGPAILNPNGSQAWYFDGLLHRKDGPAFINPNHRTRGWYLKGVYLLEVIDSDLCGLGGKVSSLVIHDAMSRTGFGTLDDFAHWLAIDVLGEDFSMLDEFYGMRKPMIPVVEEYLRNHEDYAGLPFSWWYPIVEGCLPLS